MAIALMELYTPSEAERFREPAECLLPEAIYFSTAFSGNA